jgi:hypothetical protein
MVINSRNKTWIVASSAFTWVRLKAVNETTLISSAIGLAYLMLDCWLEVSLHPEGPATGHSIKVFRGFP